VGWNKNCPCWPWFLSKWDEMRKSCRGSSIDTSCKTLLYIYLIKWLQRRFLEIDQPEKKLEKKYAPALDNYGQSCFVRSDFFKMKCVCKTQMMPPPDHKKEMKSNYLSLLNIWWKSKSCGHATSIMCINIIRNIKAVAPKL
jgi:hypothetical protein